MLSDPSFRRTVAWHALVLLGTLVLASAAREAKATDLTDSSAGLLPETSPPYARVTFMQKPNNVVEFTVTATTNWYGSEGANFGISNFTFDSDVPLSLNDIKVVSPGGWVPEQNPATAFGTFNWGVKSTLNRGTTTLVFDVTHAGATSSDYSIYNPQRRMFAANIINFSKKGSTVMMNHWVATPVPPLHALAKAAIGAVAALALLGAGAWFFVRHKKAKPLENREPPGASE